MRRLVLAAVMLGALSGAQAADMSDFLRGSISGSPAPSVNWQGYYVGGQLAYGSIHSKLPANINSDMQATFSRPPDVNYDWRSLGEGHSLNIGYGGFAGYNSQWEDVVVGVEANYLHGEFGAYASSTRSRYNPVPDIISTTHSNAVLRVSDFGSMRVRAGYIMGCFLPYAYLGAGMGSQTIERNVSASPAPLSAWSTATKTKLVYGYSAGVGLDVMLVGGLFTRLEYEYQRVTSDIETNINTVRLGLGYKF
jgi:opacity protein-like surface antigen